MLSGFYTFTEVLMTKMEEIRRSVSHKPDEIEQRLSPLRTMTKEINSASFSNPAMFQLGRLNELGN